MKHLISLVTRRNFTLSTGFLVCLLAFLPIANAGDNYILIVNAKNTVDGNTIKMVHIKNMLMRNKSKWKNGTRVKPHLPPEGSAQYSFLLSKVLKINRRQLDQHWLQLKQRRGVSPPPSVINDATAIKAVSHNSGGLALVKAGSVLPEDVRVLMTLK